KSSANLTPDETLSQDSSCRIPVFRRQEVESMSVEVVTPSPNTPVPQGTTSPISARPPRLWFPLVMLGLYWGTLIGTGFMELPYFFRFLLGMAAPFLLLIAFSIWWWTRRTISRTDRLLGFLLILGSPFAIAPLTHRSIGLSQSLMV